MSECDSIAAVGTVKPTLPNRSGSGLLSSSATAAVPALGLLGWIWEIMGCYLLLTKPRVVLLVSMTSLIAIVLEGSLLTDPPRLAGVLLGIVLAGGGANVLNQFWDRDIDAVMARTRRRPIPAGRVSPRGALGFGLILGVIGVWLLQSAGSTLAAALGAGTIAVYVLVYTMWLKRKTSLNVVIGGTAGAAAPLIGWSAGAEGLGPVPLLMFLVIFLWTPPHFWALALYTKEEYARAGVPMLPVVAGEGHTRMQIAAYILLLLPVTAYLGICAELGPVFFIGTSLLGMNLVRKAILLLRRKDNPAARDLYSYSIVYLGGVFALMQAAKW